MKKLKRNKVLKPIKRLKETVSSEQAAEQPKTVPRITNETIAVHREDVLKNARKYIYPLQHSKHKVVLITTSIVIVAIIAFFTYCTLALYKFQSTSTFLYRVTQVIPFPIARVNGHFISYEDYLFELESYMHFYETQEKVNFNSPAGQQQLKYYKNQALNYVIDNFYVNELAKEHNIKVSDQEVDNQIYISQENSRMGTSPSELSDVLKTYYGWSISDFKRKLKEQLLRQDLVSALDTQTHQRAQNALNALNAGQSFAVVVGQYSDDQATKGNGGLYGFPITKNNVNIPVQVVNELYNLKPGQYSGIINTGYALEIVENISEQGNTITAAHIVFNFQDISNYINPLKEQQKATEYIKL